MDYFGGGILSGNFERSLFANSFDCVGLGGNFERPLFVNIFG